MKKVLILMLGLVAGTASFATSTDNIVPATQLVVTNNHSLKLTVVPEEAYATIQLRDEKGHVLYRDQVSLQKGISQTFNLSQLESGTYQIAVMVGNQSTVKTFQVGIVPAQTVVKISE